jgi:CelD/BcsL family acetyltransferase involved in cellulose biosynthesis
MELTELALPREAEPPRPLTRSRAQLSLPPVAASAPDLSCEIVADPAAAEALRPAWADLLERSGRNELTLTPDWLLTWLRVYGPKQGRRLSLALFRDAGRLVGLAPLLSRPHWHRAVLPFRRLEFLGSGEREGHGICSNHLNVVAERGAEAAVARRLATALTTGSFGAWDELVLPMMDADGPMPALLTAAFRDAGLEAESFETARGPYIPLPATWDAYLKSLSCTRRHHLTRSLRAFDQWAAGTARLVRVTDMDGLEKGKRILIDLHHARWASDSGCGVFRAPSYLQFHNATMRWLLERGALELLYLTAHGRPVAALYGMSWGDKVYAYQIGRRLDVPANVRPGGVILAHAIRAAIEAGRREFDFLANEAPFKTRLALATRSLVQVRVVRPGLRETTRRLLERCLDGVRPLRRVVRGMIERLLRRREEEAIGGG